MHKSKIQEINDKISDLEYQKRNVESFLVQLNYSVNYSGFTQEQQDYINIYMVEKSAEFWLDRIADDLAKLNEALEYQIKLISCI